MCVWLSFCFIMGGGGGCSQLKMFVKGSWLGWGGGGGVIRILCI